MANGQEFTLICYRKSRDLGLEEPPGPGFLKVPPGYHLGKMTLQGNFSIAAGYNFAMRHTAARYKIYLQEGVTIAHRDFLGDILSLFQRYPRLGLLGVIGAKSLPANGIWWESPDTCGKIKVAGKVIEGSNTVTGEYESVRVADGILMATQYDLPWREDLFRDCYFYDTAQCLEFIKAGYEVGVIRQTEPWIVGGPGDDLIFFQEYRRRFVKEYGGLLG
ncbi:MAG: glycosyltransferase family protein [Firmicutes bacterium]|nr:glycosyltransferase family protein [Bacillota bacterium]